MAIRAESQIDLSRVDDGAQGADGTTFTPSVDSSGNISWTNDGGKPNPPTQNIMGPSSQYFWYESSGTDAGAHITEVPQEEWQDPADPNYQSGGNVLAKTNEIAVRDGMTNVATFGVDGAQIGQNAKAHIELTNSHMKFIGNDGMEYVDIGDSISGTIQQAFRGDGVQTDFLLLYYSSDILSVVVDGVATSAYTVVNDDYGTHVVFDTPPPIPDDPYLTTNISIDYEIDIERNKAFTIGTRPQGALFGMQSYVFGTKCDAEGKNSFAEGYRTFAMADFSHAQGLGSIASEEGQTAIGKYGNPFNQHLAFLIGNGTSNDLRSNALTVDWDGNTKMAGTLTMLDHDSPIGFYETKSDTVNKLTGTSFASISGSAYTPSAGRYLITASARYSGASSGNRGVCIYQGGAVSDSTQVLVPAIQSASWATDLKTMGYFNADGSTEFRIGLLQNSGSSLSTTYSLTFIRIR